MIDVTYTTEYARFKERYYGLKTAVLYDVPVQYTEIEAYLPHHDYMQVRDDITPALLEKIKAQLGVSWIEARFIGGRGFCPTSFAAFILDVQPDPMRKFDKKTRNEVRRSLEAGFVIEHLRDTGVLYELYRNNMRRHGTPPKSNRFLPVLFECFGDRAMAIAAYRDGELAGANVVIRGDRDARLVMNLSRPEFWAQYVNNRLYWETIQYALSHKISVLDFGGSLISDASHNHFKLGFGAQMVPIVGYTSGSPLRRLSKWIARKKRNALMKFRHG